MSRCFPFPRPGHLKQGLVESIKIDGEKVRPKTEQKLHEKERKDKKKERKGNDRTQCTAKEFKKLNDFRNDYNDDHLEKSDLTEEHDAQVCYISDGSQNSHKRKRETVSLSECKVDGKKIKIKFSLKKPCLSGSIGEKPSCSSSGRVDSKQVWNSLVASVPEQKLCHGDERKEQGPSHVPSSVALVREQKLKLDVATEEQRPSPITNCSVALVPGQKLPHDDARKKQGPSSSRKLAKNNKILKAALQYKTLLEDWLPPVLQPELNNDDNGDNWLLPKKHLGIPALEIDGNDVPCHASLISWPQAQYLPEAEIYALPYTVPY